MTMENVSEEFENLCTTLYECPDDPDLNETNEKEIHNLLRNVHIKLEEYLSKLINEPTSDAIGIFCIDYFERLIYVKLSRDENRKRFETLNLFVAKNMNEDLFRYIITAIFCSIYSNDETRLKRLRLTFLLKVIEYAESSGVLITTVFSTDNDMTLYNFVDYILTLREPILQLLSLRIAHMLLPELDYNIANKFFPHEKNMQEALLQFKSDAFEKSVIKFLNLIKIGAQRVVSLPLIDVRIGQHVISFNKFVTADAVLPSIYACFDCCNEIFSIYILASGEKSTVVSVHKSKIKSATRTMKSQHVQTKIMLLERVPTFFIDSVTGRSITCTFREDVTGMLENIEEEFVNYFLHEKQPRQKRQYGNTSYEKEDYCLDNCDALSYISFSQGIQSGDQSSPEFSLSLSIDCLDLSFRGDNDFITIPDANMNCVSPAIFDSGIRLDKDLTKNSPSGKFSTLPLYCEINPTVNRSEIREDLFEFNEDSCSNDAIIEASVKNDNSSPQYLTLGNEIPEPEDNSQDFAMLDSENIFEGLSMSLTSQEQTIQYLEMKNTHGNIQVKEVVTTSNITYYFDDSRMEVDTRTYSIDTRSYSIQENPIVHDESEDIFMASTIDLASEASHVKEEDVDETVEITETKITDESKEFSVKISEHIPERLEDDNCLKITSVSKQSDIITNLNITKVSSIEESSDLMPFVSPFQCNTDEDSENAIDLLSIISILDNDIESNFDKISKPNATIPAISTIENNSKQIAVIKPKKFVRPKGKFDSKSICKLRTYKKNPLKFVDCLIEAKRGFRKLTLILDTYKTSSTSELNLFTSLPTDTKKLIFTSVSAIRDKVGYLASHLEDYILDLNNS